MLTNNCSLCGMICQQDRDMCETCSGYTSEKNSAADVAELSDIPTQEDNQTEYFPTPETTAYVNDYQAESNFDNHANNYQNYQNDNSASAGHSYSTSGQSYRDSKPKQKQEFRSTRKESKLQFIWDLSPVVKFFIAFIIFCVGFALALRGFMQMDLSVVKTDEKAPVVTEEVVPWFSSWFRSAPSAEEIFDQYEKVTYAEGGKTISKTFKIKGSGGFLTPKFNEKTWEKNLKVRELKNREDFNKNYLTNLLRVPARDSYIKTPKMEDYYFTFEAMLKAPDKLIFDMSLSHKKFKKEPKIRVIAGDDGKVPWLLAPEAISQGNDIIPDEKKNHFKFDFGKTEKAISLSFPKANFTEMEFKGEEPVLGRMNYHVEAKDKDNIYNIYFDKESGLVTKVTDGDSEMFIINYSMFNDSLFPSKFVHAPTTERARAMYVEIDSLEMGIPLEDSLFVPITYNFE